MSKRNTNSSHVSATALRYTGPIIQRADQQNTDLVEMVLIQDLAISSGVGGVISPTFAFNNPSSATDWSSAIALYDEYRVLGMRLEYHPNAYTASAVSSFAPVYSVIDRDSASALGGYSTAVNYASCKEHSLDRPFSREMKMESSAEAQFFNTSALPTSSGSIKLISTGLSNSTGYGRVSVYYMIQFRGRGV